MGNLLAVVVHAANIHDTKSGIEPAKLAFERYPTLERFCADAGYRGTFVLAADCLIGIYSVHRIHSIALCRCILPGKVKSGAEGEHPKIAG